MPLSGGTSGAHDDAMHQGNAKRGVDGGVAALNGGGDLLVPGTGVGITRDVTDRFYIIERVAYENVICFTRVGVADYKMEVYVLGVRKEVQHAGMKDVVSGIAALDAAGALLLPGSKMYFTRDGSDDVHIYERTSDEEAYAFHRVGADDYTFFVKESNVWKRMQTESMKDVADGIAGLDASVQLDVLQMRSCLEEYSNHLGAVDNFTQTATGGNGTANTDAANHEMDMLSGVTVVGHASFRTKSGFAVVAKPIIFNGIVQNIVLGAGGSRWVKIGFAATWTGGTSVDSVCIVYDVTGVWFAYTAEGIDFTKTTIPNLANGDLITIVATSSEIIFLVNGAVVATHTTDIPTNPMKGGIACGSESVAATTSIQVSADMIGMKRYV